MSSMVGVAWPGGSAGFMPEVGRSPKLDASSLLPLWTLENGAGAGDLASGNPLADGKPVAPPNVDAFVPVPPLRVEVAVPPIPFTSEVSNLSTALTRSPTVAV